MAGTPPDIYELSRPNAVNGNQSNAYADKYATALKLFSGEVFTAFQQRLYL